MATTKDCTNRSFYSLPPCSAVSKIKTASTEIDPDARTHEVAKLVETVVRTVFFAIAITDIQKGVVPDLVTQIQSGNQGSIAQSLSNAVVVVLCTRKVRQQDIVALILPGRVVSGSNAYQSAFQ